MANYVEFILKEKKQWIFITLSLLLNVGFILHIALDNTAEELTLAQQNNLKLQALVEQKDAIIAGKDKDYEKQKMLLAAKDAELANSKVLLAAKDKEIDRVYSAFGKANGVIEELKISYGDAVQEKATLEKELNSTKETLKLTKVKLNRVKEDRKAKSYSHKKEPAETDTEHSEFITKKQGLTNSPQILYEAYLYEQVFDSPAPDSLIVGVHNKTVSGTNQIASAEYLPDPWH